MRTNRRIAVLVLSVLFAVSAQAAVKLPNVIDNHMVLQQGKPLPIWGWADAGEEVTVSMCGQEAKAVADANGNWSVKLDKMKAGGPFEMTVAGKDNSIALSDILVGEVWVCSGQSNMQWTVGNSNNAEQEIAEANYPNLRLFYVPRITSAEPLNDCVADWTACTPQMIPEFSAVAYYFGRMIHKELGIPVGLIHTSWGGTPAESWTRLATLESNPITKPIADRWAEIVANYPAAKEAFDKQMADWQVAADKAKADGQPEPAKPGAPAAPDNPGRAASLYNGMIAPLVPYAIQGAIWYQGESNADRAFQYRTLFPMMIEDWRNAWDQGPFAFEFVQLANWQERKPEPGDDKWAELREAQTMTLELKNTGMAVVIDIGDAKDIHPRNKQDVGKRLALNALANVYDKDVEFSGPMYKSMDVKDNTIVLSFKHADGLQAMGGEPLTGFAIAGEDRKFVWAKAVIDGKKVVVSADGVAKPVAVRYAWAINPECNLFNGAGLPASPFRTDDWPCITLEAR